MNIALLVEMKILDIEQGSEEWLQLRKTKVTATDAAVIMNVNPWKSCVKLFKEKKNKEYISHKTIATQRGIDLEPLARDAFTRKTGIKVNPVVVVDDWLMASLDGLGECGEILEIKCAGKKDHALALKGKIPKYYYPQLQHQMMVLDQKINYYFSFDGIDGVVVPVYRDYLYTERLKEEEYKFYTCMLQDRSPEDKALVDDSWVCNFF